MHLKNTLSKFIFAYLVFCFHSTWVNANAPESLNGYKILSSFEDQDRIFYFISNSKGYIVEDGIWEPIKVSYSASSDIGNLEVYFSDQNSEVEIILNFNNQSGGSFAYNYSENDDNGISQVLDSGSGTFNSLIFNQSEIPNDKFFSDDFQSELLSVNHWNLGITHGIKRKIQNGNFLFSGTLTDPEERWFEIGGNTILSLEKDWTVESNSFANLDKSYNFLAGIGTYVGFDEGTIADMSIGVGVGGYIFAECYVHSFKSFASQYKSTFRETAKEGTFRIFNSHSDKTISLQYWRINNTQMTWQTIYEFNWQSGTLTEKNTFSAQDIVHHFSNWSPTGNGIAEPMLDVVTPNINNGDDEVEIIVLNEGDLGFTSFSVSEGAPEPDPEYAPSSLVGKIYKGSMNDTYQFIDESNAIFYHQESNFQNSEVSNITYTWSPNGNSGTLTTSLDETTTLSFTSASEGTFSWNEQESGETSNGTFTLEEATTGNAPSSLSGDSMIAGTTTYVFKENGVVTIRSTTGSQDSTYGFVKSGNNEIVFNIPAHADGVTSTLYKMTFSSTGEGTLSEGGSGSFEYFIDGSNQPSSKDWMWFDEYPWVYSHIEGGWLYFTPTSSKLMVFSVKDQAWREMKK